MNFANSIDCKYDWQKGVDINRNFAYNYGTQPTSLKPCKEEYRGKYPFSEK